MNISKIILFLLLGLTGYSLSSDNEQELDELHAKFTIAVYEGDLEKVQALIKQGVDVNFQGHNDRTPLMDACTYGYTEIFKLLLDNGANFHMQDNEGVTALMIAAENAHIEIVKLLLNNDTDEENGTHQNDEGNTAIELTDNEEIVDLLKCHQNEYLPYINRIKHNNDRLIIDNIQEGIKNMPKDIAREIAGYYNVLFSEFYAHRNDFKALIAKPIETYKNNTHHGSDSVKRKTHSNT